MPEDRKTRCTAADANFSLRVLHVTLVLASLTNQISMVAPEMVRIESSMSGAASETNIHSDRWTGSRGGGGAGSLNSSGLHEYTSGTGDRRRASVLAEVADEIKGHSGRDNNNDTRSKSFASFSNEGGDAKKTSSFGTKLSASAPSSSSSLLTTAAASLSSRPTSSTSTLSASTTGGIKTPLSMGAPHPAVTAGITNQKTVPEQHEIIMGAERIITPLPLIDRQPDASAVVRPAQQNIVNKRNQSSSHSPVNDLQVDEKHFLNEIVKNFNKSIVLNPFESSHTAVTATTTTTSLATLTTNIRHTIAANERPGTILASTNHIPRAVVPAAATESSTSPILNLMRASHARTHSSSAPLGGAGGVSSNTGTGTTTNRNAVSKIHYKKSDSAMLNYIFDSHVKHRHSDMRFGPHFVEVDDIELLNSSAVLGGVGLMSCKISQLQDKTVSWVRRLTDTNEMLLLTVAMHTYSSDARFRVDFQYPDDWRLRIDNVTKADEGTYVCQISTHPPQAIQTNFYVSSPEVLIVDEQGLALYEKFYNLDSLLELNCIVNHITMTMSVVHWHHGNVSLNYDATRGGIRVGTNLTEDAANSTLWVARVKPSDSGNYTCSVGPHLFFTTSVHVLNESLAELHHGHGVRISPLDGLWLLSSCITLLLLLSHSTMLLDEHHLNAMPVPGQHIR